MQNNVSYNYKHDKLGNLVVSINGGQSANTLNTAPLLKLKAKYGQKNNVRDFLTELYTLYMDNDNMSDLIGSYFLDPQLTTVDKVYEKFIDDCSKKTTSTSSTHIKVGDGIFCEITLKDGTRVYSSQTVIKRGNSGIFAYLDKQYTEDDFRRQGLSKIGINCLINYLGQHGIRNFALQTGEIGGVSKDELNQIYQSLGFTSCGNGKFAMHIPADRSM